MYYVKQAVGYSDGTKERIYRYCCDSISQVETTFENETAIELTLSKDRKITERLMFCDALLTRAKETVNLFIMNINGKTLDRMQFGR